MEEMEDRLWLRAGQTRRLLLSFGVPMETVASPYQSHVENVTFAPAWAVLAADLRRAGSQREKLYPIERRKRLVCALLRSEERRQVLDGLLRLSGHEVVKEAMREMVQTDRERRRRAG